MLKYLGYMAGLVFVYLVVENGNASSSVLNSLSAFNTNTILALQGRNPSVI